MRKFNLLMAAVIASLLIAEAVLCRLVHLYGFGRQLKGLAAALPFLAICAYSRWRGFKRFSDAAVLAMWGVLATRVLGLLIQIAARSPAPLVDGELARLDHAMHFEAVFVVTLMAQSRYLRLGLALCYALLILFVVAALLVPPLCGRRNAAERLVVAVIVAAIITAALFAIFPAIGPWVVYGFAPTHAQAAAQSYLLLLKSNGAVLVNFADPAIVSFPSFHVVLAILCMVALWNVRRLRWFSFALGFLICVSTVTTGWHYVVDIAGGLAVAWIADRMSRWVLEPRPDGASLIIERASVAAPAADRVTAGCPAE